METTTHINYIIAIVFLVYFLLSFAFKLLNIRNIEEALFIKRGILLLNLKHSIGIVLFGVLSYMIAPEFRYLISVFDQSDWQIIMLGIVALVLSAILAFNSARRNSKKRTERPSVTYIQAWNYFPIRILFLFAYEFFFRGVIFFSLLQCFDLYTSILITTILYVLIHSFDSRAEILGAIPFGIVLCFLTYFTNSIWIAFSIHMTLSVVYELNIFKLLTSKTAES